MVEKKGDNGTPARPPRQKSKTPTMPFGVKAMPEGQIAQSAEATIPVPDLPQPPVAAGEQVAAQVQAVSQVAAQPAQPERPANHPQYLAALAFVKAISPQISQEAAKAWVSKYMQIDEEGTIRLNKRLNSIENLQDSIQFPDKLAIIGHLSVWPSQHEIRVGGKMYIDGNLVLINDANIVFGEAADFYVGGDVCYARKTPADTVKILERFKKAGRIQGKLEQR